MTDQTLVDDNTGESQNIQAEKTYSQKDFDDAMARMKSSLTKKLLKPYEDLGDPDELRQLREAAQKQQQELQMKRGEFDKILQESLSKKDLEIQKRDKIIQEYKIEVPLTNAAAQFKAINAEQVKALLKNNIRLNEDGEVEVVDVKGTKRYNDNGEPFGVQDLVKEFLDSNPHFVQPTIATTTTKTNIATMSSGKVDLSALDFKNPQHRKLYAEAKAKGII